MSTVLFIGEVVGITYTLWCIFVFAFVSTLETISKKSWHFKVYLFIRDVNVEPADTCEYRKILILAPLKILLRGLFFCLCVFIWFCTLIVHWTILPFFWGKIPTAGFSERYFTEFLEDGPETSVDKFINLPPVFWLLIAASSVGGFYYLLRLLNGDARPIEYYITIGVSSIVCLILGLIYISTRPSFKTMWQLFLDRVCIKIPVVD